MLKSFKCLLHLYLYTIDIVAKAKNLGDIYGSLKNLQKDRAIIRNATAAAGIKIPGAVPRQRHLSQGGKAGRKVP